jgi:hypothetical protein
MSTVLARPATRGNLALAQPRPQRVVPEPRRHLGIAPTPAQRRRARPRLGHALVVVGGIGAILLVQLLLSFALADGAYYISTLQGDQRDLLRQEQALDEQIELLGSTQHLTESAEVLGMVASGNPQFLDVSSGGVTGDRSAPGTLPANLVANSLLDGSMIIDPAALAAAQAAEAASGDTGATTLNGSTPPPSPGVIPSPNTH